MGRGDQGESRQEDTGDGMEGGHFCLGDKSKGGVIPLHTGVAHCGGDL